MNKLLLILLFASSLFAQEEAFRKKLQERLKENREEFIKEMESPISKDEKVTIGGMAKLSKKTKEKVDLMIHRSNERICFNCYRHEEFIIKSVYHDLYERDRKEWKKLVEKVTGL